MESEEHVCTCRSNVLSRDLEWLKRELKRIKKNSSKLLFESALHTMVPCIKIYFYLSSATLQLASTTCTDR